MIVLKDTGHIVSLEGPEEFVRILVEPQSTVRSPLEVTTYDRSAYKRRWSIQGVLAKLDVFHVPTGLDRANAIKIGIFWESCLCVAR